MTFCRPRLQSVVSFITLAMLGIRVAGADTDPVLARIREQGMNHSQVTETMDYLCNVIGERLTASPSQARASKWTRSRLESWGLANAHLEPWGPFGRGWTLERFSLQVIEPYTIVLNGYPKAWSPGLSEPTEAEVVYVEARTRAGLQKYEGKLRGKVVLLGAPRKLTADFDPLALRLDDQKLNVLAGALAGHSSAELMRGSTTAPSTTQPATAPAPTGALGQSGWTTFLPTALAFAQSEGAVLVIDPSSQGDGGTIYVAGAVVPRPLNQEPPSTQSAVTSLGASDVNTRPRAWAVNVPVIPPQVTLETEQYNRLVRMIELGEKLKVAIDLRSKFYPPAETHPADTVAEIPGSDLKDQIVMVGGHLDSWHSGTGATDNGAGAASAMEAVRILRALDLHPRRTIRVALWTGEEQGLLGSTSYVKQHFGHFPESAGTTRPTSAPTTRPIKDVIKTPEYEKLSVYFNLDNGTGKIRGIYAQGNAQAVPYFQKWLQPFADLGASTVTLANTGSTDHIPFDTIGLPGFQFIQDPIEYRSRTHHSNADVFERIQFDDLKEASTIMATFLWDAANLDERFPRKP